MPAYSGPGAFARGLDRYQARTRQSAAAHTAAALGAQELRKDYSADDLHKMLKAGHAIKNAAGEPSFPIGDAEDLGDAIRAVGRAGADHDGVRKYIIKRARALKLADRIPGNWNRDGSLKDGS